MARFTQEQVFGKMADTRLLPLFNIANLEVCKSLMYACYEAGIHAFELTNRDEKAFQVFEKLVPFVTSELPGLSLGAGTILDASTSQKFIDAGADFIIAPNLDLTVGESCIRNNIPWIPGCLTPSEIQNAYKHGAEVVKLFPAGTVGPEYLNHLKGPMPFIKIIVTGGVLLDPPSVKSWLDAGVFALGVGSQMFSKTVIQSGEFDKITVRLKELITFIHL